MKNLLYAPLLALIPCVALAGTYTFSDSSSGGDGTNSTFSNLEHGTAYSWGFTSASLGSGGNLSSLESSIAGGATITSATLTLTGISDWQSEKTDVLYVDILNGLSTGAHSTTYMPPLTSGDNTYYGDDPFNPNSKSASYNGSTVVAYSSTYGNYNHLLTSTSGHIGFQSAQSGSLITTAGGYSATNGWTDHAGDPGTFTAYDTTASTTLTITLTSANIALLTQFLSSDATGGSTAGQDLGLGLGPDCDFTDSGISLAITTKAATAGVPDGGMTFALFGLALAALAGYAKVSRNLTLA